MGSAWRLTCRRKGPCNGSRSAPVSRRSAKPRPLDGARPGLNCVAIAGTFWPPARRRKRTSGRSASVAGRRGRAMWYGEGPSKVRRPHRLWWLALHDRGRPCTVLCANIWRNSSDGPRYAQPALQSLVETGCRLSGAGCVCSCAAAIACRWEWAAAFGGVLRPNVWQGCAWQGHASEPSGRHLRVLMDGNAQLLVIFAPDYTAPGPGPHILEQVALSIPVPMSMWTHLLLTQR